VCEIEERFGAGSSVQSTRKGCQACGCGHGRGVLEGTLTSVDHGNAGREP